MRWRAVFLTKKGEILKKQRAGYVLFLFVGFLLPLLLLGGRRLRRRLGVGVLAIPPLLPPWGAFIGVRQLALAASDRGGR